MDDTVTISKDEYHKLQVLLDICRRDYIAVTVDPKDAPNAIVETATAAEWKAAIEALDE